jgi:hypothetical protein
MDAIRISRRRFVTAGAMGAVGALLAPEAVFADENQPELIRWDLTAVANGAVVPCGTDVAKDAKTGDTLSLTGSGFAHTDQGKASGGGTFVHLGGNGVEVAHGIYYVTGFKSFKNGGGSLVGVLATDAIGKLDQTTGGDLFVTIHAIATNGDLADGVLGVHCQLPGSAPTPEGFTLTVDGTPLKFEPKTGLTLFHVLED